VNLEVSFLPTAYDRDQWGMEVRPIVAWEDERWLFVVNPIVDISLAGPDYGAGPTFEPAAMAKVKIAETVAVGFDERRSRRGADAREQRVRWKDDPRLYVGEKHAGGAGSGGPGSPCDPAPRLHLLNREV
jgi:hypothetical protein